MLYSTQATSDANKGRRKLEYNRAVFSPGDSGGGNFCSRLCFFVEKVPTVLFRGLQEQPVPTARAVVPAGKALLRKAFRRHRPIAGGGWKPYGYNRLADIAFFYFFTRIVFESEDILMAR